MPFSSLPHVTLDYFNQHASKYSPSKKYGSHWSGNAVDILNDSTFGLTEKFWMISRPGFLSPAEHRTIIFDMIVNFNLFDGHRILSLMGNDSVKYALGICNLHAAGMATDRELSGARAELRVETNGILKDYPHPHPFLSAAKAVQWAVEDKMEGTKSPSHERYLGAVWVAFDHLSSAADAYQFLSGSETLDARGSYQEELASNFLASATNTLTGLANGPYVVGPSRKIQTP